MSDYSSTYPTQSPVFAFDAKAGKLDSRLSYSRSSGGTYMSSEKHLSSLNLTTNSNDLSDWSRVFITRTLSQVGPDGSSNAAKLTGQAGTVFKAVYNATLANTSAQTISFFAKEDTHRYIQVSVNGDATKFVNFDLNGAGAVSANGSGVTASITASGNGYLRCAVNLILPSTSAYISLQDSLSATREAATASTGSIYIFGAMSTTLGDATNVVAYQSSGSQIHREFASTLKTAAADAARFEYAADGQSVGTPKGLLVESQASNLYPNSGDMTGNSGALCNVDSNVAVGPAGDLTADALRLDDTDANAHYRQYNFTAAASTAYTFSAYVKASGLNYIAVRATTNFSSAYTFFNVSSGTVGGSPSMPSTIESVGNGWFRCSVTATSASATTSSFRIYITDSPSSTVVATGDSYRSVLGTGIQIEAASAASSMISTSGATATRAADSCSVATADFGYTGGPVTIVGEVSGGNGTAALADLRDEDATLASYLLIWKASAANTDASNFVVYSKDSGNLQVNETVSGSGGATTIAVRLDTDNFAACADGGTLVTDTSSVVLPSGLSKLWIASAMSGYQLDSTIKNLRFYNVALSDTELQAITS